ncbi:hypothetical protein ACVJGD_001884 [Bradyrhizobium sp. USDA 10063]
MTVQEILARLAVLEEMLRILERRKPSKKQTRH